ncbi:response regulator [Bacteroides sp. 214]|uniref:two-component regulator propeller domain-containing protein n=1 Tax=Bacteroides sp. 214 TaxID=2302935 RepID=UPI0013D1B3C4|nr:two-component regulator propeller domain-containing protein [Bacteroides sp. 214]NDW12660.1 response regulator [Bacteroides sp. 214]
MRVMVLIKMLLIGLSTVVAQPLQGEFSYYTPLDGLVHNHILDIHTDSRGFLWLCTWNGISRFDGYRFKNYCNDPDNLPIQNNRFISVDEDMNGHLWFRTYDGHIYRFNRFTEVFENIDVLIPQLKGKPYKVGNTYIEPNSASAWVEFQGFGVARFIGTPDALPLIVENYIDDERVGSGINFIDESSDRKMWLVCDGGQVLTISPDRKIEEKWDSDLPVIASTSIGDGMAYTTSHAVRYFLDGKTTHLELDSDIITCLAASTNGNKLFVGTQNSGIKIIDIHTGVFEDNIPSGSVPKCIQNMKVDSHNTVWITTPEAGISRFDTRKNNYKHFMQSPNTVDYFPDSLTVVLERNDVVWVKMKKSGFGYYNREMDQMESFYNDSSKPDYRMTNGVTAFEIDSNNVMWISPYYEKGLIKVVIENAQPSMISLNNHWAGGSSDDVRALMLDSSKRLWVGTKNGWLSCYNEQYELLHSCSEFINGVPIGRIYAIFEDSSRTIWVGTKGNGLWRLTPDGDGYIAKQYRHSKGNSKSISDDNIYAITEDGAGNIWIATYGGGVNRLLDAESGHFVNMHNGYPNYPKEEGARVRYILSDIPERMLVATTEGLIVFNPLLPSSEVQFSLYQRHPNEKNSIGGNDVIHILKDAMGRVWLSTHGGGLSLIAGYSDDDSPVFINYTTNEGLLSNIVLAAVEDNEKNIWLSTEKGIVKLNPERKVFTNYTEWNSFSHTSYSETSAVKGAHNEILFGGMNKLHIIDPYKTDNFSYDYKLTFTSFEMQNKEAEIGVNAPLEVAVSENGTVHLPYDYLLFRIEFASLNYEIQKKVSYMYYLDGYDNDWTISRDVNSAYYSKVSPGEYTFRVKAFVGNEQVASPEITLKIQIATPPWLSWYAYCVYSLLLLSVIWIAFRTLKTITRLRSEARIEQQVSEIKLRFFTNISHELRTPLTLILGGIEDIQRREALSEKGVDSLNMSYKNSKRMLTLINQLLDFRKIVKDKMELKVKYVDVALMAQSVLDDFRDMVNEHSLSVQFSVSHQSIFLWIDPERMEGVFYNLLSNAIKFTPDMGVIRLSIVWQEEQECVWVAVSDTGIGIHEKNLNSIFTRFSQHNRSLRGNVSGSGIGLALCKEIVELHQGTIEVESKKNEGTKFTIKLLTGNLHFGMDQIDFEQRENEVTLATEKSDTPVQLPPPEGMQNILLVEDNAEMRRFIHGSLIENYNIVEAVDGVDALEKMVVNPINMIVTDLMMPRMDGIELVNKVRGDFRFSHIPIIMLTAKDTSEDRLLAMKYGADAYITKPFSMNLLQARIDNLLAQRRLLFERFSTEAATQRLEDFVPKDIVVTNRDQEFMKTLMKWVDENISNTELKISDLSSYLGLGRTVAYNKIKALTGKSPVELIKEYRVIKAESLLRTGQFSVSEIGYQLGFSDPAYFSRCFKERYKVSPKEYIRLHNLKDKE